MKHLQRGFTIVEIAVVVSVIAVLASIIIVSFANVQKRSRDDTRITQAKTLSAALKQYYGENGEYPNACGGANIDCDASALSSTLVPVFISSIPTPPPGPNGNTYTYRRGSTTDSYGIKVPLEAPNHITVTGSPCKTGNNVDTSWWGGSTATPACPF